MVAAKKKTKTDPKRLAQARKNYADHGYLAKAEYNQRPEVKKRRAKQAKKNYKRRKKNEPEKIKAYNQKSDNKLRKEILSEYSQGKNTCRCCGKDCTKAWDLDHIDNTGNAVRAKGTVGTQYYRKLRTAGYPQKDNLQILCCNCNSGKQYFDHKKTDHKRKTYTRDLKRGDPKWWRNKRSEHKAKLQAIMGYCKYTKRTFRPLFEKEHPRKHTRGKPYEKWWKESPVAKYIQKVLNKKLRCENCGETWFDFLTLNHKYGGGEQERKLGTVKRGKTNYSNLVANNLPDEEKWNVLCYDCQRIDKNKRHTKS